MCLAGAGAILGIFGSILGAVVSASAAQAQADAESAAATYNAAIERRNAQAEAYKGSFESEMIREKGDRKIAQQRAAFGVSGALVDTGSPLTVFGDSTRDLGMDAASAAWDARVKNQAHLNAANLYMLKAENAKEAGRIGAMSAMVGAIGGISKGFGGQGSSLSLFG